MVQLDKIKEALQPFILGNTSKAAQAVRDAMEAELLDAVKGMGGIALLTSEGDRLDVTKASVMSLQLAANKAKKAALKEPWATLRANGVEIDDKLQPK